MLLPIVATFEHVRDNSGKSESGTRANEMLSAICKCEFFAALCIAKSVASLLLPLSVQLQSPALDILQAVGEVENIMQVLSDRRANAEREFREIFAKVQTICES